MDLPEPLTDFTIIILPRKLTGHFLYVWAIWNMSVLQDSLTTISWGEIGGMAVEIAGKVIEREINEEDHTKLINDFIENVGEAS